MYSVSIFKWPQIMKDKNAIIKTEQTVLCETEYRGQTSFSSYFSVSFIITRSEYFFLGLILDCNYCPCKIICRTWFKTFLLYIKRPFSTDSTNKFFVYEIKCVYKNLSHWKYNSLIPLKQANKVRNVLLPNTKSKAFVQNKHLLHFWFLRIF